MTARATFRQADLDRALKAAEKAGLKVVLSGSEAWSKDNDGEIIDVLKEAAAALQSSEARALTAEQERDEAHRFMEAEYQTPTHDQCEEGGPLSLTGRISHEVEHWKAIARLADARALTAEQERDDLLDRVEELEQDAEIVSAEFEKDLWRVVRGLLEKVGWTDFSEGVTADLAGEILFEAIETGLTAEGETLRLREGLELAEGIEPLLNELADCLPEERRSIERELKTIRKAIRSLLSTPLVVGGEGNQGISSSVAGNSRGFVAPTDEQHSAGKED